MKQFLTILIFFSMAFASSNDARLAIDIKQSVMSPCCWSGTVYDHGNKQMETEIDDLIAKGKTKQEILDHYVDIYGERILAVPIATGFNLFAWLGPLFIAIVGVGLIVVFVRSNKKKSKSALPGPSKKKETSNNLENEIEKELEKMD